MPATTKKTLIAVVLASLFGQAWVSAQVTHYPSRGTQTQARQPRNSSAIRPTTMRYPTNRLSKPQPSTPRSQSNWPNQSWTNPFNARRSNVPPGQRNQMSSNNRTNRSVPGNQLRNNARSNPQPGSLQYPQRIAQTQYSEEDIQQLKAQHYRAVRQANYQDAPSTTLPRSDMNRDTRSQELPTSTQNTFRQNQNNTQDSIQPVPQQPLGQPVGGGIRQTFDDSDTTGSRPPARPYQEQSDPSSNRVDLPSPPRQRVMAHPADLVNMHGRNWNQRGKMASEIALELKEENKKLLARLEQYQTEAEQHVAKIRELENSLLAKRRMANELQKALYDLEKENSKVLAKLRISQNKLVEKEKEFGELMATVEGQVDAALKALNSPQVQNTSSRK